jgi:predicted amidohydrolase
MKDLMTKGLRLALFPELAISGPAAPAASRKLAECFAEADSVMQSKR